MHISFFSIFDSPPNGIYGGPIVQLPRYVLIKMTPNFVYSLRRLKKHFIVFVISVIASHRNSKYGYYWHYFFYISTKQHAYQIISDASLVKSEEQEHVFLKNLSEFSNPLCILVIRNSVTWNFLGLEHWKMLGCINPDFLRI